MKPRIGIIGGTGAMGQLFSKYFQEQGLEVTIASRSTELSPQDLVKAVDVVIVCVPIRSTVEVIDMIAPLLTEKQLLMDFTSLKADPMHAMLKSKAEVIGCHPMFGPGVSSLKGQTIVLCPERADRWRGWAEDIFARGGASIKISNPERHDAMMTIIQGIPHFSTISLASTLKRLGIDIHESFEFTSPIYRIRMDMVGRLLNQDPELYTDIEMANEKNLAVIDAYLEQANMLRDIIARKDRRAFIEMFQDAATHFGNFTEQAQNDTNYLIDRMVER